MSESNNKTRPMATKQQQQRQQQRNTCNKENFNEKHLGMEKRYECEMNS